MLAAVCFSKLHPVHAAAVLLLLVPTGSVAQNRAPFHVAGRQVAAGTRVDIDLIVPAGATDPATNIPISVFYGARNGPVLAITMGVHGYEFAPILAGQELLARLDPGALSGTVIMVRLAHVEAFERRVPYVNPFDRKNLNRVFPGRADGSQAERIAWALTTEVIRRCDAHIEVHGGDAAEWLEAFVGIYGGPLATGHDTARTIGLAMGFRNVIKYAMNTQQQIDTGRSLNRQAVADKKPTILVEIGENGRRDQAFVTPIVSGIENVLRTLKMMPGDPARPRADVRWFDDTASADATTTGILTPVATTGRLVVKGETLGTIRDYTGRVLEEVKAPIDGYALYGLAGPPVRAGDTVVTIAIPAKRPL
jgi:uncharacterized protein